MCLCDWLAPVLRWASSLIPCGVPLRPLTLVQGDLLVALKGCSSTSPAASSTTRPAQAYEQSIVAPTVALAHVSEAVQVLDMDDRPASLVHILLPLQMAVRVCPNAPSLLK